jgi:hypothetical protein
MIKDAEMGRRHVGKISTSTDVKNVRDLRLTKPFPFDTILTTLKSDFISSIIIMRIGCRHQSALKHQEKRDR